MVDTYFMSQRQLHRAANQHLRNITAELLAVGHAKEKAVTPPPAKRRKRNPSAANHAIASAVSPPAATRATHPNFHMQGSQSNQLLPQQQPASASSATAPPSTTLSSATLSPHHELDDIETAYRSANEASAACANKRSALQARLDQPFALRRKKGKRRNAAQIKQQRRNHYAALAAFDAAHPEISTSVSRKRDAALVKQRQKLARACNDADWDVQRWNERVAEKGFAPSCVMRVIEGTFCWTDIVVGSDDQKRLPER